MTEKFVCPCCHASCWCIIATPMLLMGVLLFLLNMDEPKQVSPVASFLLVIGTICAIVSYCSYKEDQAIERAKARLQEQV